MAHKFRCRDSVNEIFFRGKLIIDFRAQNADFHEKYLIAIDNFRGGKQVKDGKD
jgi:hypothetical protein